MMNSLFTFLLNHWSVFELKLFEQFYLVGISTIVALIIGIPLGVLLIRFPKIKNIVLSLVSAMWTIPSLALLAFFIPFMGIGVKPAIVTLSIYAILPILRNTVTGLDEVPEASIEAARGLGFTGWQSLWMVELPLAMPVIIAGIRTAISITVGVATLAAFIGAGGLGDFINQGLALNNTSLLLLGAIPAAIMALVLDFIIGMIEKSLQKRMYRKKKISKVKKIVLLIIILLLLGWCIKFAINHYMNNKNTVIVGSKNFTEQIILGNMMTDMISAKTNLHVVKKLNLGSTAICQAALMSGEIDMYPEYTGTAYLTVLHEKYKQRLNAKQIFDNVKQAYLKRFNLVWLPPFGFNNSQAIAVKKSFAEKYNLKTISDLVPIDNTLVIGAPAAFLIRPDAYPGLKKAYDLHFKEVKQLQPGLMYSAIKHNDVNVIEAFSTDGRIPAFHLVVLKDDKHFYPPYDAAIIIRKQTLDKYPQVYQALKPLFGAINTKTMQHLNAEVNVENKSPAQVAKEFLISRGFIKK